MSAPGKPQILLDQVPTRGGLRHISRRQIRPYSAVQNRGYTPLSKVGTLTSIIVLGRGFNVETQYITYRLQDTSYRLHCADSEVFVEESKTRSANPHSQKKTQGKKTLKMWNVRYEVRRT